MSSNNTTFGTNNPIMRFAKMEASGGILLFLFATLAMICANTPGISEWYNHLWHDTFAISFTHHHESVFSHPLHFWINDFLMVIFFFVVGLEIKRELLVGELSSVKKALLPVLAAVGGMVFPIAIFLGILGDHDANAGWGVPMATDIAFSLGVLSLFGKRVPTSLKVFLTAFAIADDLGAVIVIAVFLGHGFQLVWFLLAILVLVFMFILNRRRVNNKAVYIVLGIVVWYFILLSGVHTTIAGVLVAMMIPVSALTPNKTFYSSMKKDLEEFNGDQNNGENEMLSHKQIESISNMQSRISRVQSPLQSFEHSLQNFVTFFVLPLFAFANAGVSLQGGDGAPEISLSSILPLAVMGGLFIGKLIGIFSFSWLAVKLKIADLPEGMNNKNLVGLSLLGGVGFTMALFVANLSYTSEQVQYLNEAKLAILTASGVAALVGYLYLNAVLPKKK